MSSQISLRRLFFYVAISCVLFAIAGQISNAIQREAHLMSPILLLTLLPLALLIAGMIAVLAVVFTKRTRAR